MAVVAVAHLALVPLELLAVLAGAAFGSAVGGAIAVAGGWLGASAGYVIGRALGPVAVGLAAVVGPARDTMTAIVMRARSRAGIG